MIAIYLNGKQCNSYYYNDLLEKNSSVDIKLVRVSH